MLDYAPFSPLAAQISPGLAEADALTAFEARLVPVWIAHYQGRYADACLGSVQLGAGVFLFDVGLDRLVAAWAASRGAVHAPRDRARMARFPKGAGRLYHRGHAVPHSLGGPLDLNLVPQLGSVNVGDFRALEKEAVATMGSLYFTYWYYGRAGSRLPVAVDQGLLRPGRDFRVRHHTNAARRPGTRRS